MESLEKAIRTAFDKGDPLDSAYRKRVYRSALTALEKSTSANPAVTDEMAASRRDRLKDVIRNIETEFRPAVEPAERDETRPAEPPAPEMPAEPPAPEVQVEAAAGQLAGAPEEQSEESTVPPVEVETPEPEESPAQQAQPEEKPAPQIEVPEAIVPDKTPDEAPEVLAVEPERAAAAEQAPEPVVLSPDEKREPQFDTPSADEPTFEAVLDEARAPDIDTGAAEAPVVMSDDRDGQAAPPAVAPAVDEPAASGGKTRRRKKDATPPEEEKRKPRSRGLLLPFLVGLAILIGGVVYLFYRYGDTSVATSGDRTHAESAAPALRSEQQEDRANWITVFNAGDPSTVSTSAGTELEILDRDEAKSLRVNAKGSKTATVTFEVGPGIMRDLAGKQAIFDIAARAQEGKMVEISVECDFGTSGGCGRQRYEVGFSPGDYLFDVEIPAGAGDAAGKIVVRPDSAGSGAFIDISEMRATVPAAE